MTRIRVSAEEIAALGQSLAQVAADVRSTADRTAREAWALGPGASAGTLVAVAGDFDHQRLVLGRALAELARIAQLAGGGYAEVEAEVRGSLGGGAW
jgi:hypothetical protein